jgi:hypothetical protein
MEQEIGLKADARRKASEDLLHLLFEGQYNALSGRGFHRRAGAGAEDDRADAR